MFGTNSKQRDFVKAAIYPYILRFSCRKPPYMGVLVSATTERLIIFPHQPCFCPCNERFSLNPPCFLSPA